MKVKSRSVCQNCRQRKYGCDGKRPACSQCLLTKRSCPGYESVTFVSPTTAWKAPGPSKRSRKISVPHGASKPNSRPYTDCLILNFSTFRWSTDEEFVALVIEYFIPEHYGSRQTPLPDEPYSTICSPWLEVLPLLLARSRSTPLLSVSLRTFGYSIICKGDQGPTRSRWDICRAQSYAKAVQYLKHRLAEADGVCDESAAAIMCLCIAEWLIPTSREGWVVHIRGIGQMMELCRPESFTKPISQQLFVGFRPLIILEACISRQNTFLSSYEWRTIPFACHEPSFFQILLSHGSVLPSLLRKVQYLDSLPSEEAMLAAQDILTGLVNALRELDGWERSLQAANPGSLFWPRTVCPISQRANNAVEPSLWFCSLPVAMSLTHLWAFRAVCFSVAAQLLSSNRIFCMETARACLNVSGIEDCQMRTLGFHSMIRQSMLYFKQDEMKFYGAASVTLPIRVTQTVLSPTLPLACTG
ncbi:hypothetical protein BJX96DRAFT_184967 [Aspergillus floccosus]